ncbi:unnamed protein product [Prorocentrum cordatum]|uniref:EF-hand domain-containing protein n=1 Tax=Prorocentrum cordatum TaxID=2364126 RepID=A0ABN9U845_9DINO|nr:unnamed protein product [Polarella glacialis]
MRRGASTACLAVERPPAGRAMPAAAPARELVPEGGGAGGEKAPAEAARLDAAVSELLHRATPGIHAALRGAARDSLAALLREENTTPCWRMPSEGSLLSVGPEGSPRALPPPLRHDSLLPRAPSEALAEKKRSTDGRGERGDGRSSETAASAYYGSPGCDASHDDHVSEEGNCRGERGDERSSEMAASAYYGSPGYNASLDDHVPREGNLPVLAPLRYSRLFGPPWGLSLPRLGSPWDLGQNAAWERPREQVYPYLFRSPEGLQTEMSPKSMPMMTQASSRPSLSSGFREKLANPMAWKALLDELSLAFIVANSFTVAFSLDLGEDWPGWFMLESFFTLFFVVELFCRVWLWGLWRFLTGPERFWHFADIVFVSSSIVDTVIALLATTSAMGFFSILRLIRLIRVARMLRVVKKPMFRELLLMLELVKAGMSTTFWAAVVLSCVVFMLGLMMRQTLGRWCVGNEDERSQYCKTGHLADYTENLFSTLPRACFTVFRCFTEGCESVDGTPLLVHILEIPFFGTCAVCCYFAVYMFVVFGVFNIITGVLVEKSIASARLSELAVAQEMKQNMLMKCKKLGRLLKRRISGNHSDDPVVMGRQVFATIVATYPDVLELLQDIVDIEADSKIIFDVIDVKHRGLLDVDDFVMALQSMQLLKKASPSLRLMEAELAFAALSQSAQVLPRFSLSSESSC